MDELLASGASPEQVWTGAVWTEGPVWLPGPGLLRFSDIPNDRIVDIDAAGQVRQVREGVEFTNGRTLDLDGHVVQCSHGRRRVERDVDGTVRTVVDSWQGGRLNSPNDVVVASDGAIWFTDPPYGIHESGHEGHPGEQEYGGCFVFRHDPATGATEPVVTDMTHPNGLAFSPDESVLYVADSAWVWDAARPRHIRAYDVEGTSLTGGRVLLETSGVPDGLRVDAAGRVWTSSSDVVQVVAPDGRVLAELPFPERVSNLCFGGADGRDLYVTATSSIYRVRTGTTQAPRGAGGPAAG